MTELKEQAWKEAQRASIDAMWADGNMISSEMQVCICELADVQVDVGNPDMSPIYYDGGDKPHKKFFNRAEESLAKWPTEANLDFWMDACAMFFFDDMIGMHSVLSIIFMNRGGGG